MSLSDALELREGDRERLEDLAQRAVLSADLARRAQIVLLAADGMPNAQIARVAGVSRPTVIGWRDRYRQSGIGGLNDEPRSGRPRQIDELDVVTATLTDGGRPPARLGADRWSARLLAAELGVSFASVARIWRKWGLSPSSAEGYTLRTDPGIVLNGHGVAGLYLDAQRGFAAIALADSAAGGSALAAALTGGNGHVSANGHSPGQEPHDFVRFLARLAVARPGSKFRVVCDSGTLREQPAVRYWLAGNPEVTLHLATADCPWLAAVQIVCGVSHDGDVTRHSGKDVTAAIGRIYDARSQAHPPFTWVNE